MVGSSPLTLLLQLAILVSSSLQEKGNTHLIYINLYFQFYVHCSYITYLFLSLVWLNFKRFISSVLLLFPDPGCDLISYFLFIIPTLLITSSMQNNK